MFVALSIPLTRYLKVSVQAIFYPVQINLSITTTSNMTYEEFQIGCDLRLLVRHNMFSLVRNFELIFKTIGCHVYRHFNLLEIAPAEKSPSALMSDPSNHHEANSLSVDIDNFTPIWK